MSELETKVIRIGARRHVELQRRRDGVEIIGLVSVLVPIWLFLVDGGVANFEIEDVLSIANRLTALVGTSLLLVHLALVARIPWLESTLGLDKLTAHHKRLGKPLFYLLLIHSVLAVISYAEIANLDLTSSLVSMVTNYFDLLLALLAMLLMVVVVISSIRIARRRLSYESWYLVHLVSYVAILAAIPHQLNLGTDFLSQPLMRSWFTLLYLFVFGHLLWFRILQPVVLSLASNLKIVRVTPDKNQTTSLVIGGRKLQRFDAQAGQFFLVRVLTKKQWWRPHPFSVSNAPDSEIRFTIGNRGDDTELMQKLEVGTRVILEGPFGVFTEEKRTKRHVTLMAAGIGVAPIRSLAESLAAEPGDVTIVYRATDLADAALLDEVERISFERGHKLHVLHGPRGEHGGFLPEDQSGNPEHSRLLGLAPQLLDSDIYVCGPAAWSNSVKHSLNKLGVSKHQVHIEEFAW